MWTNSYVGLPWKPGGRLRSTGLDCWGLYRLVLCEQKDLALPLWGDVGAHAYPQVHRVLATEAATAEWRRVDRADCKAFDCVLMRGYFRSGGQLHVGPLHVGCVAGARTVLHIEKEHNAVCVQWDKILDRVLGIYRHRELE